MSDFSPSAGAGAWIVSRSGGAPTPAPSPNPHNPGMRNMPYGKPFQCGICYDFLSHSVDELDEHIMKHKRDLADRLHNRAQSEADRREFVQMNQSHQPMLYYADGTHAGTQVQGYEYQPQSCSAVQQFQEYRPHATDCKSASKYYSHHPALLAHHRQVEQAASTTMTEMYSNECPGRSDGGVASGSIQHEDYADGLTKRGRYETHAYEREDPHQRHAARPDLNEENTADADPSTDHMKESEYGPVSFAEAQQSDPISYHELQAIKSTSTSADGNIDRSGAATGHFGSAQEGSANDHQPNGADASRMHGNGAKLPDVQSSRDSGGDGMEADPTSSTEDSSKGNEMLGDGNARSDTESLKSHEDPSIKSNNFDVGHNERVPRTRRSARMQTSRR